MTAMTMLKIENLDVSYGGVKALHGVSLEVHQGEIVTLIGANGAGKTTLLKTISGLNQASRGRIAYKIENREILLHGLPPHEVVREGVSHVPEGRRVFPDLTVKENMELGAYLRHDKAAILQDEERLFGLFPRLKERLRQRAGTLSGGEQQMLAIARALMARPRLLLMDEPSLGLAPILVKGIFAAIQEIQREGITILLVEQNAHMALKVAQRGYVLESGRIVLEGPSPALEQNEEVKKAYLGG